MAHGVRKALLAEIEKLCNAYFSGSIDFEGLGQLAEVAMGVQDKFGEEIFRVLSQKLTESQVIILGVDAPQRMPPLKGILVIVDELLLNWVTACYQTSHAQIKSQLEGDAWTVVDLEEKVADLLEYIRFLGKPHDENESFYVVKKQVIVGQNQYSLSRSFISLLDAIHSFMTLIFRKKAATFHLTVKMIELVMVGFGYQFYTTYLEDLLLAGKALEFKVITKINTKAICRLG